MIPELVLAATLSPDFRATQLELRMTRSDMLRLVDGLFAVNEDTNRKPVGAIGSAGFIRGVPALRIPNLQESDAGLGIANPDDERGAAGYSIALPSGLATASSWDPQMAYRGGAMIGNEAHEEGFNVLLAGAVDLARDPRNGRNFEYPGEDPLLAGTMVGNAIAGIQAQHVISTVKHFGYNDQETNRGDVDARILPGAARESDLLAFQVAIEIGHPGAVMCSYNRVNTVYACENDALLNGVLKRAWGYPGFVMSDWGAVHSTRAALAGLDQESANYFDSADYFGTRLAAAIDAGTIPVSRLHDMVHRILRSMFADGLFDDPPAVRPIDARADSMVALKDELEGAVLLKNDGILPLDRHIATIAVIGMHADSGVLSGGGSSQVWPIGGPAFTPAKMDWPGPVIWDPSSPLAAIRAEAPEARVIFDDGTNPASAARIARQADVAIVFAYQWLAESIDAPNLSLPDSQDALIARVAAANPHTVVVLETGDPVVMPWLARVRAVLEAWYPGQAGGTAIAQLLFGDVSPSGRLPITFPASVAQLPRTRIDPNVADYNIEGSDVGYRWFERTARTPLFPFGYGLTYTTFRYAHLRIAPSAGSVRATFDITNSGKYRAAEVAQLYVALPPASGERARRLAGWARAELAPGETRALTVRVESRILDRFDVRTGRWVRTPGTYRFFLGRSSADVQTVRMIGLSP